VSQQEGVRVHTCHNINTKIRTLLYLEPSRWYYTDDPKFKSFKALPEKCDCKKVITDLKASVMVKNGTALQVYKPREGFLTTRENSLDRAQIITVVNRAQTTRVDVITRADMERAYNDLTHPFNDPGHKNPRDAEYMQHIEDIHAMIMEERRTLIVPYEAHPDDMFDSSGELFPGRLLHPFGPDQRTVGGHK
jgi:hypothetical protein